VKVRFERAGSGVKKKTGGEMTADEQAPLHHEIILYATPDGSVRVEVLFESESFWLTQKRWRNCLAWRAIPSLTTFRKSTSPMNSITWQLLEKFE
jgi:hypothetical protein